MNIETIRKFIGKQVGVGVPHHSDGSRLFYYYGLLKDIEDNEVLVLDTKNGLLFVDIEQVKQFHVENIRRVG